MMTETKEYMGTWWLPDQPNTRVWGTLKVSTETGSQLTLMTALTSQDAWSRTLSSQKKPPTIVLGESLDGQEVTLSGCLVSKHGTSQELICNVVYIGCHVNEEADLRFDRMELQSPLLSHWLDISGFTTRSEKRTDSRRTNHLDYNPPRDIVVGVGEATVTISFGLGASSKPNIAVTFTQIPFLSIDESQPFGLNEWNRGWIAPIRNLLSIATGAPCFISRMHVYGPEWVVTFGDGTTTPKPIEVLFGRPNWATDKAADRSSTQTRLFTYRDIEAVFADSFNLWMKASVDAESAMNLYFGPVYNQSLYADNRFLMYSQGIEAYHRARGTGGVISQKEHKQWVKDMVAVAPKEMQARYREALSYAHEPRYGDRIHEILEGMPSDILSAISPSQEYLAKKLKDTRNYFTHHDVKLRHRAAQYDGELFWLTHAAGCVLQDCILRELRFDLSQRGRMLGKTVHFSAARLHCPIIDGPKSA